MSQFTFPVASIAVDSFDNNLEHRFPERRMKTRELTETNVSVARATKESLRVRYAELLRLREKVERLETGNEHRAVL